MGVNEGVEAGGVDLSGNSDGVRIWLVGSVGARRATEALGLLGFIILIVDKSDPSEVCRVALPPDSFLHLIP